MKNERPTANGERKQDMMMIRKSDKPSEKNAQNRTKQPSILILWQHKRAQWI